MAPLTMLTISIPMECLLTRGLVSASVHLCVTSSLENWQIILHGSAAWVMQVLQNQNDPYNITVLLYHRYGSDFSSIPYVHTCDNILQF